MSNTIKQARRTLVKLFIGGNDATSFISPSLLSFSYTDNISGKADEVQITMQDRDAKWTGAWKPEKGLEVKASFEVQGWPDDNTPQEDASLAHQQAEHVGQTLNFDCGTFKIDSVSLAGPPDVFTIKAVTSDLTNSLRDSGKSRAWENTDLQNIASQVAAEHGLELHYEGASFSMQRQDQREEADLPFIARIAKERGMECKVHNKKLILFDSMSNEQKEPLLELRRNGKSILSYSFSEESSGTDYNKAEVKYTDTNKGETHTATASVESANAKTLQLNRRAESSAEAMHLAGASLHNANKGKSKGSLSLMGNPRLFSGMTVKLADYGDFSGTYLIEKATHKIMGNGGYTTDLNLRKTMATPQVRSSEGSVPLVDVPNKNTSLNTLSPSLPVNPLSLWQDTFEPLKERFNLLPQSNDRDKLLLCLPNIAEAMAGKAENAKDAQGWLYLQSMFHKWFSGKANTNLESVAPFWVDIDWILSFPRALLTYDKFITPLIPMTMDKNIANQAALEQLAIILCRNGYMTDKKKDFDFISLSWQEWEEKYHTLITVERNPLTDGLMVSMAGFTLRALAKGAVEPLGNQKYRIHVTDMAVFAHDGFQFAEDDSYYANNLGWWSCNALEYTPTNLSSQQDFFKLTNEIFRNFSKKYNYGSNFLVLSMPKRVANFEGARYEFTCIQDSQ